MVTTLRLGVLSAILVSPAFGLVLQPTEAESRDILTYQFLPGLNFETAGPGFQSVLAAARTTTGHDVHALLAFDLDGLGLTGADVTQATIGLYVRDGASVGFPFANPTPAAPVTVNLTALGGSWDEATVGWGTEPAPIGGVVDSVEVDGIGVWVTFDVTSLVQAWLDGTIENHGVVLTQLAEVIAGGQKAAAVFDSSSGANRPYLEILPEPGSALLLLTGLSLCLAHRRTVGAGI